MSVYGYVRVSTDHQVQEGDSLDVQKRQIEGYCLMCGLEPPQTFVELGVSGGTPIATRPEGSKLMAGIKKGDTVIASKLDRMFRNAGDCLNVIGLFKKRRISLVLIDFGGDVIENPNSKLLIQFLAVFAEGERDKTSDRVKTTKRDQKSRNKFLGGKAPYGKVVDQQGDLVDDPGQQAIIREVVQLHTQGMSYRRIQVEIQSLHSQAIALNTVMKLCRAM